MTKDERIRELEMGLAQLVGWASAQEGKNLDILEGMWELLARPTNLEEAVRSGDGVAKRDELLQTRSVESRT